jgi:signal transduction histidine kinase
LLDLERVEKQCAASIDDAMRKRIAESKLRLQHAQEDIHLLLEDARDLQTSFDLVEVVDAVLVSLAPLAEAHPCRLVRCGQWPESAFVTARVHAVNIAITDIVDNAIKYSWKGRVKEGRFEPHQVRIYVTTDANNVSVRVTNYGIGIPPEFLDELLEGKPGYRANVPDDRSERDGTGMGFATAVRTFEEFGGWIDAESVPADGNKRELGEEYHRYVTEVWAVLPLTKNTGGI